MIAAQLYTVRDRLRDPGRLAEVLGRLGDIGYRAVEVAGLSPAVAERFGQELRRVGLVACAAHESLERLQSDLSTVAAQCRDWGCRYLVVPGLPPTYHSADGFRRFAEEAARIAQELATYELRLAYHNHSFELERWEGKTGLDILFEAASPEALSAELDTFWLQAAGASPSAWLRKMAGRTPLVHLKDMAVVRGRIVQAEVGEGNLDWSDILSACRESRAEWLVVEQDESGRDPLESLAISYQNLTNFLQARN